MISYLKANGIRIFDFAGFSQTLTGQVRRNAQQIAAENGIEIEFIRKPRAFRKDDRIYEILSKTGKTEGLIHIFSAMEQCNTYKPWHDKSTGKTFLKFDQSKCLHYYFYFIDKESGLCYLRVPTWAPFRLHFYINGHNILASKLQKKKFGCVLRIESTCNGVGAFRVKRKVEYRDGTSSEQCGHIWCWKCFFRLIFTWLGNIFLDSIPRMDDLLKIVLRFFFSSFFLPCSLIGPTRNSA